MYFLGVCFPHPETGECRHVPLAVRLCYSCGEDIKSVDPKLNSTAWAIIERMMLAHKELPPRPDDVALRLEVLH